MLQRWFVVSVCILALACGSRAVGDDRTLPPPGQAIPGQAEEEKAVREVGAAYLKAFNAGDAKALAALWTPDGDYMDETGRSFRGRAAIEKDFTEFFKANPGLKLTILSDTVRFLSREVAMENGTAQARSTASGPGAMARFSIVHVKRDGKWQMASVREAPHLSPSNYDQLRDLEWLVGAWSAKGADGQVIEITCAWAERKNFLRRAYQVKDGANVVRSGMQIIGWDPRIGRIRSWIFDSDGAFGEEVWQNEGTRWLLEATGTQRDGGVTQATNILTKIDDNAFTWQSVRRIVEGNRLPDTAAARITRVSVK